MGRASRHGRPNARKRWVFLAFVAACILAVHCADDPTEPQDAGSLTLELDLPSPRGADDSLSIWIEDSRGRVLAGPARSQLASDGTFDLSLEVPEGEGRVVRGTIDGFIWRERGVIAVGFARGVRVRVGSTTDVRLPFEGTIPQLDPIRSEPGDLAYAVRWSSVPSAVDYELLEIRGDDTIVHLGTDTVRVMGVNDADRAVYRVRARLGSLGTSAFSDSVSIDRGTIFDLPRIVSISPGASAEDVLDRTEPVIHFDRPMDWSTLGTDAVSLRELSSGDEIVITALGEQDSLRLEHAQPFRRGVELSVSVSPNVRDLDGRPLDQDPVHEGLQGFTSAFSVEPYVPLRVVSAEPSQGAEAVDIGTSIVVELSRAFDESTVSGESIFLETSEGSAVASQRTVLGTQIRVQPDAPLAYDEVYTIHVTTGLLDLRGEPLDQDPVTPIPIFEPFAASFHTEPQPEGPRVVSVFPGNGEQNAASFDAVGVDFSRAIDPSTVTSATLSVQKLPIGANIPGALSETSETSFTFTPSGLLEAGVRYRIVATTGVRDLKQVPLDQDPLTPGFQPFTSEFRVERNVQATAVTPANGTLRVPLEAPVSVRVTATLDPLSLTEESFRLEQGAVSIPAARTLSPDGRTAILTPNEALQTFREYHVRLTAGVRGLDGGRLDQDLGLRGYQEFTSRFTTRPESLPPMVTEVVPSNGAMNIPLRPEIQVRFTKPVQPASVNLETLLLRRALGGGMVSGTPQVSGDSLSARLVLGTDLEYGTEYEIEVATWVVDRFDVRLDQDPVTPDRQAFRSRFHTEAERVAPFVTSVDPMAGATGVPLEASIEVSFSEPITASVLDAFSLGIGSLVVVGDGNLSANGTILTFTPLEPLLRNREYTVFVDTTAVDLADNRLDQDPAVAGRQPFLSTFHTVGDETGPRVVVVMPADGAVGVDPGVLPRLDFSEPLGSSPEAGIALLDSVGGTVSLSEVRRLGSDRLEIVPASLLAFDTLYRIVASAAIVDTAGNALDQDPKAPEAQDFTSSFRTRLETIRPTVLGVDYEGEVDRVFVESNLFVAFSEPIDPASLGTAAITLEGASQAVTLDLAFVDPETLRIDPETDLQFGEEYELSVTGLADRVGNPLDQDPETDPIDPFVTTFTTVPDTIAPRVIAVSPGDGAEGITPDTTVTLVFSEPMDPLTVDTAHFQLVRLDGSFEFVTSGTILSDPTGSEFTFVPDAPLAIGSFYEVRADFFLEDRAGNPLDQDPSTDSFEEFRSGFLVGSRPVADAGESVCDPPDSSRVFVDGSASFDADGPLERATWIWGDGGVTVVDDPDSSSFLVSHLYPCTDAFGCDGLDNDGDGALDDEDCDESYPIILRVEDIHGHLDADTIGVSFCAFIGLDSSPAHGATDIDTLLSEVRLDFSRAVSDTVLTTSRFRLLQGGFDTGAVTAVSASEDPREVVLTLGMALAAGREHEVWISSSVADQSGHLLDQDPCAPGFQIFPVRFRTVAPP